VEDQQVQWELNADKRFCCEGCGGSSWYGQGRGRFRSILRTRFSTRGKGTRPPVGRELSTIDLTLAVRKEQEWTEFTLRSNGLLRYFLGKETRPLNPKQDGAWQTTDYVTSGVSTRCVPFLYPVIEQLTNAAIPERPSVISPSKCLPMPVHRLLNPFKPDLLRSDDLFFTRRRMDCYGPPTAGDIIFPCNNDSNVLLHDDVNYVCKTLYSPLAEAYE